MTTPQQPVPPTAQQASSHGVESSERPDSTLLPSQPRTILNWVKKTINSVDLGAWETSLDASTLNADAAMQTSRQQKRHSSSRTSPDSTSSAAETIRPSPRHASTVVKTIEPAVITPPLIMVPDVAPMSTQVKAPKSPKSPRSPRSPPSQHRRPSASAAATADDAAAAARAEAAAEAARQRQIEEYIASVRRPQSIDLGSDFEYDRDTASADDDGGAMVSSPAPLPSPLFHTTRFLLGSVARVKARHRPSTGGKVASVNNGTTLATTRHRPLTANAAAASLNTSVATGAHQTPESSSTQFANAKMLAMS